MAQEASGLARATALTQAALDVEVYLSLNGLHLAPHRFAYPFAFWGYWLRAELPFR